MEPREENGDKRGGGRSVNDILNENYELDLRNIHNDGTNWVCVSMPCTMELKIRLPLHLQYDKVGWHWGKHSAESIEIDNHETFKDKDDFAEDSNT